jgi:phosphoribosylformylglycinamidine cyclo-ligase
MPKGMTYAGAGVDQDAKGKSAKSLVGTLRFKRQGLGAPVDLPVGFTGLIDFGDVLLSMCTDGVGTKLLLAEELGKWDTVGIDCVAMNVNDLICVGAEPLAFVDYIATPEAEPGLWAELGKGLDEGCRQANCTLIGGETSIMPEVVKSLDLSGTAMGYVKKDRVVTGQAVAPGDALIGLAASGVHSNGYTLVRKTVEAAGRRWGEPFGGTTLGLECLRPTQIYVRSVMRLMAAPCEVHGMANITGGGLRNLVRWRKDRRIVIDDPLPVPPIFGALQKWGGIEPREMWRTFNMGMGFAMSVPEASVDAALEALKANGPRVVGRVEAGSGVVQEPLGLEYGDY